MSCTKRSRCATEVQQFCSAFQEQRAKVTDEVLQHFMTPRPLLCRGVLSNTLISDSSVRKVALANRDAANPNSKNQLKKMEKLRAAEAKKEQKRRENEGKAAAAN